MAKFLLTSVIINLQHKFNFSMIMNIFDKYSEILITFSLRSTIFPKLLNLHRWFFANYWQFYFQFRFKKPVLKKDFHPKGNIEIENFVNKNANLILLLNSDVIEKKQEIFDCGISDSKLIRFQTKFTFAVNLCIWCMKLFFIFTCQN